MIDESFWRSASFKEVMGLPKEKFVFINSIMECQNGCGIDYLSAFISKNCPDHGGFTR